jgi:competence protein ComGF
VLVLFSRDSSLAVSVLRRNVHHHNVRRWNLTLAVIFLVTLSCDAVVVVVMAMGKTSRYLIGNQHNAV